MGRKGYGRCTAGWFGWRAVPLLLKVFCFLRLMVDDKKEIYPIDFPNLYAMHLF
jgi:hypothetical protein